MCKDPLKNSSFHFRTIDKSRASEGLTSFASGDLCHRPVARACPGFMRYQIDHLSVFAVLCAFAVQLSALLCHWSWYAVLAIIPLARWVTLVEHNHAHLPIFYSRVLNELLGWICQLCNGIPLEFYRVHHVHNHHRYNNRYDASGKDWSSLFGFKQSRYPGRPISRWYYTLTFPVITACSCLLWLLRSPGSRTTRRFATATGVTCFGSLALAWLNGTGFLVFFVLPWALVAFGHGWNNYEHHEGCDITQPYSSANEHLSLFSRSLGFNIGYHVEHHLKPNLHWSLLPAFHRKICHRIPPERFRYSVRLWPS